MRNARPTAEDIDPPFSGRADRTAALYRLTDRLYRARAISEVYDAALDAITETLDCPRASVLLFDDENVMRFVAWRGLSDHYRATLEGHTPWKPGDQDPAPIFIADIDLTAESQKVKDTVKAEGIRALGFVPLTADGGVIGKFMTYYDEVRQFSEEERALAVTVARQIGFSIERTRAERARQAAERQLRSSEERFRVMSELAPVMMWLSDDTGACLHLNRMLREFWGVDEGKIGSFDWRDTMHPDDVSRITASMIEAISNQCAVQVKGRYRNVKGEFRVLQTEARPRFSHTGEFLGLVGVNIDVTDRERAEAHRDLLLAELNHRVKNTLAVVQGMAHQTFKSSKPIAEARNDFIGRLAALAHAHDLLVRDTADLAALRELASQVLELRGIDNPRCCIDGPEVFLPAKLATCVAMAMHELFTNAVKYGALANDRGTVNVTWRIQNSFVEVAWQEKDGPRVASPKRRGFGTLLLERTLSDIGGSVEIAFDPTGLNCRMQIPLPA